MEQEPYNINHSDTISDTTTAANTAECRISRQTILLMLPLILILGVIPLIVRMHFGYLTADVRPFWKEDYATDFFAYYKAWALIFTTIYMLGILLYCKLKKVHNPLHKESALYPYVIAALIFLGTALLSTLFARYLDVAIFGAPERQEGMGMILIYIIILLYALWAYSHHPDIRFVLLPLGVVIVINGILGAFQFFGNDLFATAFGQTFIVPAAYRAQGTLELLFERGKIYGTMYHYNFMGSFGAMMVPLFLVLTLFLKERRQKLFCGLMTIIALFLLLGSTSRAGIVGLALAAVCFVVFFFRKIREHAKTAAICTAALLIFVLGVNIITGGLALARIPSLWNDMKAIVSSSDIDYHDRIPIRHIDLQTDHTAFTYQDGTVITISKNSQGRPVFTDQNGAHCTAPAEDGTITLGQQKFELQYVQSNSGRIPFVGIYANNRIQMVLGLFDDVFSFVDARMNRIQYVEAPSIGFEGKERLGSARGYIWSRSLPMLLEHPFIGTGPDTFFAEFPQGDYLAKLYAYNSAQMLVDKPHNLYLQIGIQQGCLSLLAFLALVGAYLVQSFRLYALRKEYRTQEIIGTALTLAIIGYLGAGFFNDSIVAIAPIFWTLLGVGIATNHINRNNKNSDYAEKH